MIFSIRKSKNPVASTTPDPLKALRNYVGKQIEIQYYIDGKLITERRYLKFPPSNSSFYLEHDTRQGCFLFHLEKRDEMSGLLLEKVVSIKDSEGIELYRALDFSSADIPNSG